MQVMISNPKSAVSVALMLLTSVVPQDTRVTEVREKQCANCAIPAQRLFRIGERPDAILPGRPRVLAQDRRGRIYVITFRGGGFNAIPEVFDSLGTYRGPLGRRGQGPGETTQPYWIDAGFDDTVRVFEPNRVILFNEDLTHIKTRTEQLPVPGIRHVVVWPNGSYFGIGYEGLIPGRHFEAIHRRSVDGTRWDIVPENERVDLLGPSRIPRPARTKSSGRFWIAQYATTGGHGYDVLQADSTLRVFVALRRRPDWWYSSAPTDNRIFVASSRVVDVRDLGGSRIAVLIAQPRPDWKNVRVDRQRVTGWWNFYDTLVEVLDWRDNVVVGSARLRGYPQRILSDTRVATYVEEDDVPLVDVWRVQLKP